MSEKQPAYDPPRFNVDRTPPPSAHPATEGLDVERLEEAINRVAIDVDPNEAMLVAGSHAPLIAVEYARLSAERVVDDGPDNQKFVDGPAEQPE